MATPGKIVGTLVPLSALISKAFPEYGKIETGELFLDWLVKTGQSAWQLLPLSETELEKDSTTIHVPSPYKGYGIGLDPRYLSDKAKIIIPTEGQLATFQKEQHEWLSDYTLFCSLRDAFGTDNWTTWDTDIKDRKPQTIAKHTKGLATRIEKHTIEQWQLHHAYSNLRIKAGQNKILLIGDMPYYVGLKSPLVWAHQNAFDLLPNGKMEKVSGIPKTPNAYFGRQVWGHPLYDWKDGYQNVMALWKLRLSYSKTLFDIVRIDHAKGFFRYGVMDAMEREPDTFVHGPGMQALSDVINICKTIKLDIFFEDAGILLRELRTALAKLGVSGIRIFRFAYNDKTHTLLPYYAHVKDYPENAFVYTTLHDTEPLLAYIKKLTLSEKKLLATGVYVPYAAGEKTFAKTLRNAVINSPAKTVIIPIQDWLLTEDRINIPGTEKEKNDPNWRYRLKTPVEDLPSIKLPRRDG